MKPVKIAKRSYTQSVRAAGEWEQSGCVDVFVPAAVTHSHCIISLADGL